MRRDVVYKTILRDMRKFYTRDFKKSTLYMQRKRYKSNEYYAQCLKYYLQKFVHKAKKNEISAFSEDISYKDYNQELILLGSILYPKCLEVSIGEYAEQLNNSRQHVDQRASILKKFDKLKIFHTYLYKFTLERLNCMVTYKYFALLYCYYFEREILREDRIQKNNTMIRCPDIYVAASNLLLKICKSTMQEALSEGDTSAALMKLFLDLPSKETSTIQRL